MGSGGLADGIRRVLRPGAEPGRFVPPLKHLGALFEWRGLTPGGTSLQLRVCLRAGIAQLVERNLAKVEVGSSSLLSRSKSFASRPIIGRLCTIPIRW
jgi:hypothetical protein